MRKMFGNKMDPASFFHVNVVVKAKLTFYHILLNLEVSRM